MIPNHEGPEEPIYRASDFEELYQCEDCKAWVIDTPRCGVCGCLICEDCWDEHRVTCTDEPDTKGVMDADEDHLRGAA